MVFNTQMLEPTKNSTPTPNKKALLWAAPAPQAIYLSKGRNRMTHEGTLKISSQISRDCPFNADASVYCLYLQLLTTHRVQPRSPGTSRHLHIIQSCLAQRSPNRGPEDKFTGSIFTFL